MSDQPSVDSAGEPVYPLNEKDWEPLGSEHWIRRHGDSEEPRTEVGFVVLHKNPTTGRWCMGGITYDIPQAQRFRSRKADGTLTHVWQLVSLHPIHVEPSLLCKAPMPPGDDGQPRSCGDHGFVRGGVWVPA